MICFGSGAKMTKAYSRRDMQRILHLTVAKGGEKSMAGIFICYRRVDAEGWAGPLVRLAQGGVRPSQHISRYRRYTAGCWKFDKYINDAVGSCDALIALIGPRWLTVIDKIGSRRLDDPKDFTRLEILTALKRMCA